MSPPRPLWQDAVSFALRLHAGQFRSDCVTPYAAHVVRVMMTVRDLFGCDDEVALAAAALHDTIEDTPADYDDIASRFGDEVARDVAALTKDMRLPEPVREPAYDDALRRATWRAKLVKLADTYDNLCDLSSPAKLPNMLERCRRALAIAEPARRDRPEIDRACRLLADLVAEHEAIARR